MKRITNLYTRLIIFVMIFIMGYLSIASLFVRASMILNQTSEKRYL